MSDPRLDFSNWLAGTLLSHAIQATGWVIPTLQTMHIVGVGLLFTSAVLVDLRVLRLLQREIRLEAVVHRFLPVIWPLLIFLLVTGSLLIVAEPRRSLLNATFLLKMALLALAIVLTVVLQSLIASSQTAQGSDRARIVRGQVVASASLLVWCGIIFAGRWIAYTQVG